MPGGAFNVAALIAELGLKPVGPDEMRVRTDIQPTLPVGDLTGLTPPHVPPSAFYGGTTPNVAALFSTVEIQCLAAGGLYVEWMLPSSGFTNFFVAIRAAASGAATVSGPAGVNSRDTPNSVVTTDAVAAIGGDRAVFVTGFVEFNEAMYVPTGQFFTIQAVVANTGFQFAIKIREVPAGPAL